MKNVELLMSGRILILYSMARVFCYFVAVVFVVVEKVRVNL
jgi:hypothetical protein